MLDVDRLGPIATEHLFTCEQCHGEAGRLTLHATGELVAKSGWLVETFYDLKPRRLMTPIAAGDADALYGIDRETVPFWCPTCHASYCAKHWETWDLFEDDFFDEKRGRCPSGHERRIVD